MESFNVVFHPITFANRTLNQGGLLPDEPGAHACMYYAIAGHRMLARVDEGAVYEDERDHIGSLKNLAIAIAQQYGLESPDRFLIFMDYVKAQAMIEGMGWDTRIEEPHKLIFITEGNRN